jgi:hypothetical protein
MRKDLSGKIVIYEDSFEVYLYNKDSNNQNEIFRSIFITDFILNKNSFRHHFVDLEDIDILNLKQFAVIKDE